MFQKVSGFFSETYQELKKVTWPPRAEVFQAGVVVMIATAFLALLIFVIDLCNSTILGLLIRRG